MADAFDHLRKLADHFEVRKKRSAELAATLPSSQWSFALLGLTSNCERYTFGEIGELRTVELAPGEVELAAALNDKGIFGPVGRYARALKYELGVNAIAERPDSEFTTAWWIVSAIRLRTAVDILVPMAADRPWSTIACCTDGTCRVRFIEDVPQAKRLVPPAPVTKEHLDWVSENLLVVANLVADPRFRMAVDSLNAHSHQSSLRLSAASLWAGVEGLLEITTELRFRISVMIASYLEERGAARISLYSRCKALYDQRSKAVHGSKITDEDLQAHIVEVRSLLSRMLVKIVENKKVPHAQEYEALILS